MSYAQRPFPPHKGKKSEPRDKTFPLDMVDLSMIGDYVVISETPLKFSPHASEAGILHGEVIATHIDAGATKLGRYVTISPTIPQNGMRAAAAAIGRIEKSGTTPIHHTSYVVVSDSAPTTTGNFPDFLFQNIRRVQASDGTRLKYITLCEELPVNPEQEYGHVIGKIVDLSDDLGLRSLTSCNVVMAVELPNLETEESGMIGSDFLSSASPRLDTFLENVVTNLSNGTLETYSNAVGIAFISDIIAQFENLASYDESMEGHRKSK